MNGHISQKNILKIMRLPFPSGKWLGIRQCGKVACWSPLRKRLNCVTHRRQWIAAEGSGRRKMQDPDYIIVGAGSAGCVLAERLSASGRNRVLVIEAGGSDRRFYVKMPLGYGKTFFDKSLNWLYAAEPDPGLAGNADHWPRGRILGGSSSINAMVWIRGAREDFEGWEAAGNKGWGWAEMAEAFRAVEASTAGSDMLRGRSGPMRLTVPSRTIHPLTPLWFKTAEALGIPHNPDFNGESQEGAGLYEFSIWNGRRFSAADAFLRPAMKRPNVRVLTNAFVTGLTFDGRRCTGVTVSEKGKSRMIRAGREVIVAAGAIASPQLLQVSGIGDPDHLKPLGIDIRQENRAVGRNLADHIGINYTYRARCRTLNEELRPWWGKVRAGVSYLAARSGPLSASLNQGGAFVRTAPHHARPNMQLYFQAFSTVLPRPGERPILSPDPWPGFSIGWSNARPKSRGEIMIRSSDPTAHPRITPNALSHEDDVAEMLETARLVRRMAATAPISGMIEQELLPGPEVVSDEAVIADFRRRSGTVYHPVSTCRMGPDARENVVGPDLRVHGMDGLRVVDCSVFPSITTGNTNAPVIALAWRAAGMIERDI